MSSQNVNDAKKECSETSGCHMFYGLPAGSWFGACEATASIKDASAGSVLYRKEGSKTYSLMFKDIL